MAKRNRAHSHPTIASHNQPIGEVLRALARVAVATSMGVAAGCTSSHPQKGSGQSVPDGGAQAGNGAMAGLGAAGIGSAGVGAAGTGVAGTGVAGSGVAHDGVSGTRSWAPVDGGQPEPGWLPITCTDYLPDLFAAPLNPAKAFDYVALYKSAPGGVYEGGGGDYPAASYLFAKEYGVACAGVMDGASCYSDVLLYAQPSDACVTQSVCEPSLVTTYGDITTRYEGPAAINDFLGTIDTPGEAVLAAFANNVGIACPAEFSVPLKGTEVRALGDGYELRTEWQPDCGQSSVRVVVRVSRDGTVTQVSSEEIAPPSCVTGRRPVGLHAAQPRSFNSAIGAFFANAAHLEAASVYAFERMARELTQLGAPQALVALAITAGLDEIRHTRMVTALARRAGGEPAMPTVSALPLRPAFEVALENAVEGCVRETYGALVAHHQAATAADPVVAALMRIIAEDETRHAELSWNVATFIEPQLTDAERKQLVLARACAVAQLMRELNVGLTDDEARSIGWPSNDVAREMITGLASALNLA